MNWNLILWFAGILGTIYGLKFVMELFKSLLGKESREGIMEAMGESISSTNKKLTKSIKKKIAEKKKNKQKNKQVENRVIVRPL